MDPSIPLIIRTIAEQSAWSSKYFMYPHQSEDTDLIRPDLKEFSVRSVGNNK